MDDIRKTKMANNEHMKSCRRHCMIVHAYYPLGETRVQREAEALLKHSYKVDVVCLRKKGEPAADYFKGVHIFRLPVRRHRESGLIVQSLEYLAFFFLAVFKVSWLQLRWRYNSVQVHNLPDFLVFAVWIPKLLGAGVILDLHDLMPEFYIGRYNRDANNLSVHLIRLQERLSCRFAHHVITVSHHWRQALIERSVAAEKVSVVMNLADDTIFRPPANRPRQNRLDGKLRLIYHGVVTQRYGLDLVFCAMARLRREAPNVHLTILGKGDQMVTLMRLADELNLNDQVTFYFELRPAEQLPKIILAADAGIVPYRNDHFTDSLIPTKLMEYAALGLPAIAARTTAISRYFDASMVEFFTPGNVDDLSHCIMKLYTNRARLASLAQGIEKFNKQYNWTKLSKDYVALVERLSAS